MPNKLSFEPLKHEYRIGGDLVPSVTQVVNSVFPWKPAPGMTEADVDYFRQRGLATHHGCRLLDENRLNWQTVSPAIVPRIQAWEKFRKDLPGNKIIESEKALGHETHRYAGTLDRLMENDKGYLIADIKSEYSASQRLQLAAYSLLVQHNLRVTCKGAVIVVVDDSAKYRCRWITAPELRLHERQFLAALTVHNFAVQYGLKGIQ